MITLSPSEQISVVPAIYSFTSDKQVKGEYMFRFQITSSMIDKHSPLTITSDGLGPL